MEDCFDNSVGDDRIEYVLHRLRLSFSDIWSHRTCCIGYAIESQWLIPNGPIRKQYLIRSRLLLPAPLRMSQQEVKYSSLASSRAGILTDLVTEANLIALYLQTMDLATTDVMELETTLFFSTATITTKKYCGSIT